MIEVGTQLCHHQTVGRSVLIVDDHPGFRRFGAKLLEAAGFTVIGEAEDGASALDAARRLRPDIVLLDVLLPDTDGFAVADELAADPSGPLVVLVSSRSAGELGTSLEASPARGFITKSDLSAATLDAVVGAAT
jgi:DNA-binding NarL/FixJ family response regulator